VAVSKVRPEGRDGEIAKLIGATPPAAVIGINGVTVVFV
jgi:hypothetical protein